MVRTTTPNNNKKKRKTNNIKNVPEKKNVGGRPKKHIDYDTLAKLCSILCTGEECAGILGLTYETLNIKLKEEGHGGFQEYYKRYSAEGKASLRRLQWKSANNGNVTMQIWLGKQILDQSDKKETAITGKDGGAIGVEHTLANLSIEELRALANLNQGSTNTNS